jgi:hypothetical protein
MLSTADCPKTDAGALGKQPLTKQDIDQTRVLHSLVPCHAGRNQTRHVSKQCDVLFSANECQQ